MTPILYEKDETSFSTNGLGRLRDCTSCKVTEERNGIYECDFEYPVSGLHYELIQVGRIVGVTHNDLGDIQPFDIVSYSKPLDGIVSFHCVHISYRQSYMTVRGTNITTLADTFTRLKNYATPTNPFTYETDMTKSGFVACFDGIPRSVRQTLGGIEGSVLDTYGGEFEWDRWTVRLHSARGIQRPFAIRYGVNMLSYTDELDTSDSYSSCIPYWSDGTDTVVGTKVDSGAQTPAGHDECVPLDLSEKFESKPTKAQLQTEAVSYINGAHPYLPSQTINVSFTRLQDMAGYEAFENLSRCELCDTIRVIFPDYNTNGFFKIVKAVWDALEDKYDEMELGTLSTTLSEALGITSSPEQSAKGDAIFENLSVSGDVTAGGKATFGAIDSGLFAMTTHELSVSASSTGNYDATVNVTKAGYYPLGLVGYIVSTTGAYSRGAYISNITSGSCTAHVRIYASSTGTKSCTAYILWIKTTA